MSKVNVILSEQDLADFLDDDELAMEEYREELQKRLTLHYGEAEVDVDENALTDKFYSDNDDDTLTETVQAIMAIMANNI